MYRRVQPSPRRVATPHLIALVAFAVLIAAQEPTVSLSSITAYSVQRDCVKQCLIGPHNDGRPGVLRSLGCTSPQVDSCYCRTAMAADVSAGMQGCINSYCASRTEDLASALSLYDHYCSKNLAVVTSAATVSLASEADYRAQPSCIQGCMMSRPADGGSNLPWALQCTNSPAYNDCVCRADQSADANKHLTACVNKWCSGRTADITSAVSLYGSYCLAARNAAPTDVGGGGGGDSTGGTTSIPRPGTGTDGSMSRCF
jgi:hypothetical protein